MEPVTSLFLQHLGINGSFNVEDSRRLCRLLIDMYDNNRHMKSAIGSMQQKLSRKDHLGHTDMVAPEQSFANDESQSLRMEIAHLKGELKDLGQENDELKRIFFGVECPNVSFRDCCVRMFGCEFKNASTFTDLVQLVENLKNGDSKHPTSPFGAQPNDKDVFGQFQETMRLQKDIVKKLEASNESSKGILEELKTSKTATPHLESTTSLLKSHLVASRQIHTINESMYNQYKKLESAIKYHLSNKTESTAAVADTNSDYIRRLITANESLKSVNNEIISNEQLNQRELQATLKALKETRLELDRVLSAYEELKTYRSKLESSLGVAKSELGAAKAELAKEKEGTRDGAKRIELLSNQINALLAEVETLKGSCKALKREKEILMATYCRVMKENDKLRSSDVPDGPDSNAESRLRDETEGLKRRCAEWEEQAKFAFDQVEQLQESIRSLEGLKNEYMMQVELLQKSSSKHDVQGLESEVRRLDAENRDLLGALHEESKKRGELEDMCMKLDKARRALKDQIQFIRDENERVLDSVKKQIRTEIGSLSRTPLHSGASETGSPSQKMQNMHGTKIQELLEQAKDDMRQAAEISSPGRPITGVSEESWEGTS